MDQQTKIYKSWPPMKRLEAACDLYRFAKEVIRAREKRRNPTLDAQTLEKKVRAYFH